MINLAGFILAKCVAASRPIPVLAPVTITVLPARSTRSGGGRRVHCARRNPGTEYCPMFHKWLGQREDEWVIATNGIPPNCYMYGLGKGMQRSLPTITMCAA